MNEFPPTPAAPPPPLMLPWEEPNAGFGSLFPTILRFAVSPLESFSRMSLSVDLVRPIAYYVAMALFAALCGQLWGRVFFDFNHRWAQSLLEASGQGALWQRLAPQMARPNAVQIVIALVLTPLLNLAVLFVFTGLCHATLVLLGGGTNGFAASLRAMSYSGTASVAAIVPEVGGLIGLIWWLFLAIAGLASAHRTEVWKTALAVLLPIVVCCLCCVAGVVAFGAAIAQAIQQGLAR